MRIRPASSPFDIAKALDRSPMGGDFEVWYRTRGGIARLWAYRPTMPWAIALARHLTLRAYPARIYFAWPPVCTHSKEGPNEQTDKSHKTPL